MKALKVWSLLKSVYSHITSEPESILEYDETGNNHSVFKTSVKSLLSSFRATKTRVYLSFSWLPYPFWGHGETNLWKNNITKFSSYGGLLGCDPVQSWWCRGLEGESTCEGGWGAHWGRGVGGEAVVRMVWRVDLWRNKQRAQVRPLRRVAVTLVKHPTGPCACVQVHLRMQALCLGRLLSESCWLPSSVHG